MAIARRKYIIPINLYETANENRLKTGGALSAYLYYGGMQVENSKTVANGSGQTVNVSSVGDIPDGSDIVVLEADGTEKGTSLSLTSVSESAGTGLPVATLDNGGSSFDVNAGDRIVCKRVSDNLPDLYEDQDDDSDTISNDPIDVPTNGVLEGYANVSSVDVYLTGDDITNGWYFHNWPVSANETGPLLGKAESVTAATNVEIDHDSVILLVTGTTEIATIKKAEPGRILVLIPVGSGVQIGTSNSAVSNIIRTTANETIALEQYRPFVLVARDEGGTFVWHPVPDLATVTLDDLSDATVSGSPANPSILVSTGGDFEDSQSVGSDANPLQGITVLHNALRLANASGFAIYFDASAMTADTQLAFDANSGGEILTTEGAHSLTTNLKLFYDNVCTFADSDSTTRRMRFDLGSVTAGQTRIITVPDSDITLADAGDVKANLVDLDDYFAATLRDRYPLVYLGGAGWLASPTIGTNAYPLNGVFRGDAPSLELVDIVSSTYSIKLGCITPTADREVYFPDAAGQALVTSAQQTVDGEKTFDDDSLVIRDPVGTTKKARFDCANINTGATRIHTLANRDIDLDNVGNLRVVRGDYSIESGNSLAIEILLAQNNAIPVFSPQDDILLQRIIVGMLFPSTVGSPDVTWNFYHEATTYTGSTAPPPSGTAILASAIDPSSAAASSYTELVDVITFSDATIPGGNAIYLGETGSGNAYPNTAKMYYEIHYRKE